MKSASSIFFLNFLMLKEMINLTIIHLENEYSSIQVKTIAVDFTDGQRIYVTLKEELSKLQIGILINNVGMLNGFGRRFGNVEDDKSIHDIINCNILSMARMCHMVLPQMIKRQNGVIVNIGSLSSAMPTPLLTIYGATKV
jgi:17beta-estradiol 17-dehydrogenase / very-long-chain 3-oxoacyl-CoA reductase